jgi:thymidylate kinase
VRSAQRGGASAPAVASLHVDHVAAHATPTVKKSSQSPRPTPSLVVSFSGLDGAGKTGQIDALVADLERHGTTEVLWVPFKMWPEPLVTRLPVSFRDSGRPKHGSDSVAGAGDRVRLRWITGVSGLMQRLLRTLIGVIAAISTGLSLRRRAAASNAELLVLDRYRIDSIVKLQYWYPDVPAAVLDRVVTALAPAPDVEIYLRVDADVAYLRKREEWTAEQLDRQARLYDRVAARLPAVLVVDGHDDPEVVADAVRSAISALR